MNIRETFPNELEDIIEVELAAFNGDPEIRQLVSDLYTDSSAQPLLSLMAHDDTHCGHVYFSAARVDKGNDSVRASLLAPLAIIPTRQKEGIGGALIAKGMEILKSWGVPVVFVLGHPTYYPRFGFRPVGETGIMAPYPIEEKNLDAWMVQELAPGCLSKVRGGQIVVADALLQPNHWRE